MDIKLFGRMLLLSISLLLSACLNLWQKPAQQIVPALSSLAEDSWPALPSESNYCATLQGLLPSSGLTDFVGEAVEANADLQAVSARVSAARRQAQRVAGSRWPSLDAQLQKQRSKSERAEPGMPVMGAIDESVSGTFMASWELDVWGRLALDARAAGFGAKEQQSLHQLAKISLAGSVLVNALQASEAREQWLLAREREDNLKKSLEIIEDGYKGGIRDAFDLYSAQAELESSRSNTFAQQQNYLQVLSRLAVLLGRPPASGAARDELAGRLPQTLPLAEPALHPVSKGVPAIWLEQRPDLAASAFSVAAQQASLGVATANRLPRLSLTGSYGASGSNLDDVLSGDDILWNALGGLTAPLFQGGALRAEQQRQRDLLAASIADYRQTALVAMREVVDGIDAEQYFSQRYVLSRNAANLSVRAERRAFEAYTAGINDLTAWLSAQRIAFDRRSQLLQLQLNVQVNRINLYLALGGGFALPGGSCSAEGV